MRMAICQFPVRPPQFEDFSATTTTKLGILPVGISVGRKRGRIRFSTISFPAKGESPLGFVMAAPRPRDLIPTILIILLTRENETIGTTCHRGRNDWP